ncbi:MAG TPA: hypothetical protein VII66_09425 [Gemmatimonadaceae bacterium]
MAIRLSVLLVVSATIAAPALVAAQSTAADTVPTRALPGRCVNTAAPVGPVSESAKTAAREIAGRAQTASIVGDNAAASALYEQAAKLDPSDATIAYALGRGYEAAGDPRAMSEYCRFLALTPSAPEAPDVKQRIAELALALPPDTTVVRIPVASAQRMPAPGAAFAAGLVIPGMGQFMTHQPVGGFLVMAAAGAGIWYGLQTQNVTKSVTRTGTDPFGNPYQYQTTEATSERQHLAVGLGAAGALGIMAAIQAMAHAHSGQGPAQQASAAAIPAKPSATISAFPILGFAQRSVGLGFAIR